MHHIISDGETMLIIMNELNKYYNEGNISELEIQYSDYAIDMKEKQENGFYDKQIEFYEEMFNTEYELVNIPEKETEEKLIRNTNSNTNIDINCSKTIDKSISAEINKFIKNQGISETSLFLTIYGFVLSKYSGQDTIYTSIININRSNHYTENMAGMFVSTLPVLLNYDKENESFINLIKENMNTLMEIFSNQNLSLAELTNKLKLKKINNSFVYQPKLSTNENENENKIDKEECLEILFKNDGNNNNIKNIISKFDISFSVIENDNEYLISINYNNNLYDHIIIENIIDSFIEIIKNINNFENKINDIEYISSEEKQKIIKEFNSDIYSEGSEKFYHEEFNKIAQQSPDKYAIVFNDKKITYRELNEMSNSLGHYLRNSGIERNDIIPVISDRSPYYIISILSISKAGGAFLPIDPKLPIERIQYILEEVNPKMILYYNTQNIIDELLSLNKEYTMYNLEKHNYKSNTSTIDNINKSDDLCYVIFTSGTTGKPKGTLITHFNIFNFVRTSQGNEKNYYINDLLNENNSIQNVLGILNFSFDASHMDTINNMVHGLTLVLVDDNMRSNISSLSKYIVDNNVEFFKTTPTVLKLFMDNEEFRKCIGSIKAILLGGEILSTDLCKYVHQYSDCRIYNEYGPTECTVACTGKWIEEDNDNQITIGKPFCNCKIYILDKYLKPVPIGVEGEIFIGGYGVGKGYLNREELTREKFIENPFNVENNDHNKIMYRTGDLGKWTRNGEIEYIGRTDFQVKIHGQRIELEEIKSLVHEMKEIKYGIVIDKEKSNGEKYLVCYYQLQDSGINEISGKDIRRYLKNKLPPYMVPNYYKKINDIPLTTNGKLNRKELPKIDNGDIIKDEYIEPETEIEKCICHMYSKLFNINENEIGKTNDFLELGGDSLNAIRLISMIEKELNVKLNIKEIYKNSLIVDLSKYIEKILNSKDNLKNFEIIQKHNSKEFPITSQQLGVYIDSIKNENSILYNIPAAYKINKGIEIDKIKKAFTKIFEKQEILRSKYYEKEINGEIEIYGFIDDECILEFEEYNYDNSSSFVRPFKLSEAPLIRVGFIGKEYLLIDMHHIISDGATTFIIVNELNKYYHDGNISELEIQYSDFAIDMKEKKDNGFYDKQIEFYREMFNTDYEIVNIPKKEINTDVKESINNNNNNNINNYSRIISGSQRNIINEFVNNNDISKTSFFLTVYGFILSKYTGQDIIYTTIVNTNRYNHQTENMAGIFVSTLPILLRYNNDSKSTIENFKEKMEILINIFSNQNLSYSVLTKELNLKKINNSFIFHPRSAVNKNYLNNYIEHSILSFNDEDINNLLMKGENNAQKFDFNFSITENENYDYIISISFNNEIYENTIIENILNSCIEVINNINTIGSDIKNIEYIPKIEKDKIIKRFNSNFSKNECSKLYYEEFSRIAKMHPERCAIVFNDTKITYKELDEMTNSLAYYLREQNNIQRNDIIPIICDRSPLYIIGILGISKSGGAYLPIDPKLPNERIKYILDEVHPKIVLFSHSQKVIEKLNKDVNYKTYDLEIHNYKLNIHSINTINEVDDTCYVLFTSGTTGKPKGTLISHFNLYNHLRSFQNDENNYSIYNLIFKSNNIQNVLGITNFSFDPSHDETINSLIHGFKLVLVDDNISNNIPSLSKYIIENDVDYIQITPTRLKLFMENEEFRKFIDRMNDNGDKYLICYFVGEEKMDARNIQEYLKKKLPQYMIPNYFKQIERFEITNNGKLDKKALPEPDIEDLIKEEYVAAETEIEKIICDLYSKLFNNKMDINIGIKNDFFELGGDSLNAIRLISMIEKELNVKLNMKEIFENSLIVDLSKYIEEILNNKENLKNVEIIQKRNSKEFPVTSQQLGVYIDSIKNENAIIYNTPAAYKLIEGIDIEKIKEAFNKIFQNQEILRTKYLVKEINGKEEIYGFIDDECTLKFEEYTYDNASTFIRPFKLSEAPLIRVGFINNEYLLIDIHHIISDGATLLIIINDLKKYYNEGNISELEIQYSDYAIDMKEKQENGFYDKQIEFYKEIFNIDYELVDIPKKEVKIDEINDNAINNLTKNIDKLTSDNINEFIKKQGITKTSLFLTIYGYILSKYSGQDVIYTSIINANRSNHYLENMAGMFVSTLPMLLKYNDDNSSFNEIIKGNMNVLMDMLSSQSLSLASLTNELKLKKINNSFIFQPKISTNKENSKDNEILFNEKNEFENIFMNNNINETIGRNLFKFGIDFSIAETEDGYSISITFDNSLYDIETIDNLIDSFIEVAKSVNKYENNIQNIEYIPLNYKNKIINEFNSEIVSIKNEKLYHEEFQNIAKQYPEKCAIVYNGMKISYKELNEKSNSLANIIRKYDIGRNDIIPIISDRSPYYIISVLAISKAGGAFLPIDPKLPIERIQFILEEVKPKMILFSNTQNIINDLLLLNDNYTVYDVQQHNYEININTLENINEPDDICYVLFTSGTTGKPKGALITHFNIQNYTKEYDESHEYYNIYNIIKKEKVNNILGITNFSFDASQPEIIVSLVHGLEIVLIDEYIINDVLMLSKYIKENDVHFINTTPTRIKLFMEYDEFRKSIENVKLIYLGGESLPINLCKYIHNYSSCKIYNCYGPTESTVDAAVQLIEEEKNMKITIGKPIRNCKIYILDKYLNPVPIGVEGEIYIGGYGIGKGYLNREDLTNKMFIKCPFNDSGDIHNEIMYKTGDLGKWTRNGEIEYLGRTDFQVKIHGHRIELGEIESLVNEIKEIKHGVVIDKNKSDGEKYLVCYYQLYDNNVDEISGKDIREYLKNKLPTYMIPNYYKKINEIPLTISEKLNRKELPEIDIGDIIKEDYVGPETKIEKCICHMYSKLFNVNKNDIGKTSDFLELGGDSLNAIRLISMIEKEFNVKLSIKKIFENSMIVDLSKYIEEILNGNNTNPKNIGIIQKHNSKEFPVTSQQLGVYIDSIKNENSIIYNIPSSFKLNKNIDIEIIKEGFNKILQNQEILKSKYYEKEINGEIEIYGFIDDECILEFEEYSFDNALSFIRPFKLSEAPLIRVGFIEDKYLLIDMHHIISDGTTTSIIMSELNKYYNESNISELEIQYSDYAIDMKEKQDNGFYDKQIEFYKEIFNIDYELIDIPKKEINSNELNNNIDNYYIKSIDKTTSDKINEFIKNKGFTKTSLFLTIYGYILYKYSGQNVNLYFNYKC
eukprot:jgi/Orpsp1_1/1186374/evm.model.d7180000050088.1